MGSKAANTKSHGIETGSPMEITLAQQYNNVGEKPTVILNTYINRNAGTPEKHQTKQNRDNVVTSSHMVVIIYYYMGYK